MAEQLPLIPASGSPSGSPYDFGPPELPPGVSDRTQTELGLDPDIAPDPIMGDPTGVVGEEAAPRRAPGFDPSDVTAAAPSELPIEPPRGYVQPVLSRDEQLVAGARQGATDQERLTRESAQLDRDMAGLARQIAQTDDPAEKAALRRKGHEMMAAQAATRVAAGTSRDVVEADIAELEGRAIISDQEAKTKFLADKIEQTDEISAKYAAKEAERKRALASAETQLKSDREDYRAALQGGAPMANAGATFAGIITETFNATLENRVADYSAVIDAAWKRDREAFKDIINSKSDKVDSSGDRVRDLAAQADEITAQTAAAKLSMIEGLEAKAELSLQQSREPLAKAKASQILIGIQDAKSRAAQEAAQARAEAQMKAEKHRTDTDLTRAKTAKELSLAGKADAAAAKLAGRGGRGGRSKQPSGIYPKAIRDAIADKSLTEAEAKSIFPKLVVDPLTGQPTKRKDGTFVVAQNPQEATRLNAAGATMAEINGLVNEAIAIRGKEGWEPTGEWAGTEAGRKMAALSTELLLANKDIKGMGVLNASDVPLLEKIQGGHLAGMKDPMPIMRDMIRRMNAKYNGMRRTGAIGSQDIKFSQVGSAPKRSIANVRTALKQSPDYKGSQIVLPANRRLANADELFELHVKKAGGDIEAASKAFAAEANIFHKQAVAHETELVDRLSKARPKNYGELQRELVVAKGQLLASGGKSGEAINEANARVNRANAAINAAQTPEAKALAAAYQEQHRYTSGLRDKIDGELEKQAREDKRKADARKRASGSQFEGDY